MADNQTEANQDISPKIHPIIVALGIGMLAMLIVTNIIMIIRVNHVPLGQPGLGQYSIFASKKIFIAYHVWGIIAAVGTGACWLLKQRLLFLVFLLLLVILMFYPYFTA